MGKTEWAAIIAALGGMLVAVLTSLYGLGESAPGVVLGLLLGAVMFAGNIFLLTRLNALTVESQKREDTLLETLKSVAIWLERDTAATQEIAKAQGLEALLTRWREESAAAIRVEGAAVIARAVTDHAAQVAKDVVAEAARVAKEVKSAKPE